MNFVNFNCMEEEGMRKHSNTLEFGDVRRIIYDFNGDRFLHKQLWGKFGGMVERWDSQTIGAHMSMCTLLVLGIDNLKILFSFHYMLTDVSSLIAA